MTPVAHLISALKMDRIRENVTGDFLVLGPEVAEMVRQEAKLLVTAADHATALEARRTEALREARRALDAIRRAGDPKGTCLPGCMSNLSEDYRINDCDCGYEDAVASPSEYARDVIALLDELIREDAP